MVASIGMGNACPANTNEPLAGADRSKLKVSVKVGLKKSQPIV